MSRSPNLGTTIFLYIFGIILVITAVILLLQGLGILPTIPSYAIWAMVLLAIGAGIIGGIRSMGGRY